MQIYKEAKPEDSEFLTKLLRRAKAHWGYPQEWMDEWQDELKIEPDYIASNKVVMLELENKVVGFYGLELRSDIAYLEHLWIEPCHIGTGLGKLLFTRVCNEAHKCGYSIMELLADPNAEDFYRYHGANKTGEIHGSILGTPRVLPKMKIRLKSTNKPSKSDA
jgi:N-acetylglutamate synthase-like GNAT family acetyltransferase